MLNNMILKDMVFNGITIKNVPVRDYGEGRAPGMPKVIANKIQDLVWKAGALGVEEIEFHYDLGKED